MYYNRFRYYDKDTGQYISPDPYGLLGGFNPYGYVHCPVGWIDPFGLSTSINDSGFYVYALYGPSATKPYYKTLKEEQLNTEIQGDYQLEE